MRTIPVTGTLPAVVLTATIEPDDAPATQLYVVADYVVTDYVSELAAGPRTLALTASEQLYQLEAS